MKIYKTNSRAGKEICPSDCLPKNMSSSEMQSVLLGGKLANNRLTCGTVMVW